MAAHILVTLDKARKVSNIVTVQFCTIRAGCANI